MAADAFRAALDRIVAVLEALTPPVSDGGSKAAYTFIDDFVEERGNGQHRELFWRMPVAFPHEHATPLTLRWAITLDLFLHRRAPGAPDRTHDAFLRAVAQEAEEVLHAMSEITNWLNANVVEVVHDDGTIETIEGPQPARAGGISTNHVVRVSFPMAIIAQRGS